MQSADQESDSSRTGRHDRVTAMVSRLADQDKTYLRRRRLGDGPDKNAISFVEELLKEIDADHRDADKEALVARAVKDRTETPAVLLVVAGWLSLRLKRWSDTQTLARELVGRDHHDLLAQRLIDAAEEKSADLETATDRWLKTRTCNAPFREMESRANGQVHFCCSAWQPVPIGRLDAPRPDGFWNSERAREIRRSVLDGDFTHCSRWHCPSIAGRRLPERTPGTPAPALRAEKGPQRVILSHDRSCNISCPSCRTGLISLPHKETTRLNDIFEEHLLPLVRNARHIKVTGSGDPFGSRHFRHILQRLTKTKSPARRIQLHTNGLLLNERAWNDLNLQDNVSSVWISIDAAEPETYSVLRRGGDFDTLVKNLRFLGNLNKRGDIDTLRLDFVVQQANYLQMPAFVDLARDVGADSVYFLRLRNWGHVPAEVFRNQDVCSPDHPEHDRLLTVLTDDRFISDAVELGSMSRLVSQVRQAGARR